MLCCAVLCCAVLCCAVLCCSGLSHGPGHATASYPVPLLHHATLCCSVPGTAEFCEACRDHTLVAGMTWCM